MYMEALGNDLPDDDDPRYHEYEAAEGQFKEELEKSYPQVSKRCAPLAQGKMYRADYYAGTQNMNKMAEQTMRRGLRSARGTRDDWSKWSMRLILGMISTVVYASLWPQVAWHIYSMFATSGTGATQELDEDAGLAFDQTPRDCVRFSLRLNFSQECHQMLGSYIPRALLASLLLTWYNPVLKAWFHHTFLYEQITGQTEYFRLQAFTIVIRAIAWYKLSDTTVVQSLTTQQLLAAHGFVAIFMLGLQWLSNRTIKWMRFRIKQKMTPKPEVREILGAYAGPENEEYNRQASSIPPSQLFARDRIDRLTPFPIANLASRQPPRSQQSAASIPSPPRSDETDDERDSMELDNEPVSSWSRMPGARFDRTYRPKIAQKRTTLDARSLHNHGNTQPASWSSMREEIYGLQDNIRATIERQRQEAAEKAKLMFQPPVQQSPFGGQLPPAPMSMERRLRNPVSQLAFKETPASKQQKFMQQMRNSIEQGKTSTRGQDVKKQTAQHALPSNEEDDDFSPSRPGLVVGWS